LEKKGKGKPELLESLTAHNRVRRSTRQYLARIILRSAIRLALTTYPPGSMGGAATIVQSIFPPTRTQGAVKKVNSTNVTFPLAVLAPTANWYSESRWRKWAWNRNTRGGREYVEGHLASGILIIELDHVALHVLNSLPTEDELIDLHDFILCWSEKLRGGHNVMRQRSGPFQTISSDGLSVEGVDSLREGSQHRVEVWRFRGFEEEFSNADPTTIAVEFGNTPPVRSSDLKLLETLVLG
jgi:hypothetical protein